MSNVPLDDLRAKLIAFLGEQLLAGAADDLNEDTELLLSGQLDSLAVAQLIDFLEEALNTTIPPGDLLAENFNTVRCICEYLQRSGLITSQ